MKPVLATALRTSVLCIAVAGCAFSDGQPFGQLDVSLTVTRPLPDDRLDDQGRFITAADYAFDVDTLTVQVAAGVARVSDDTAAAAAFDPAAPPPGYSLCHNGHCHHESGSLVDYEDIAAELAAGSATGSGVPLTPATSAPFSAGDVVALGCPDRCFVPLGSLRTIDVQITGLTVTGRVFDRRTGDAARLPDEGLEVAETFDFDLTLSTVASATIDRSSPLGIAIALGLEIPVSLFDRTDWSVPIDSAARAVVIGALTEQMQLSATLTHFESIRP
ncbi:MAG: hypothetical protein ACI9WU_000348 [Myxococcota bacterium]|jgi:hypothetical protein